jgi:hypothetical protein
VRAGVPVPVREGSCLSGVGRRETKLPMFGGSFEVQLLDENGANYPV